MKTETKLLGKVSITPEGEHDINKEYDRLSMVNVPQDNKIYISKKRVPVNVPVSDTEHWVKIFDYTPKAYKANKIAITDTEDNTIFSIKKASNSNKTNIEAIDKISIKANGGLSITPFGEEQYGKLDWTSDAFNIHHKIFNFNGRHTHLGDSSNKIEGGYDDNERDTYYHIIATNPTNNNNVAKLTIRTTLVGSSAELSSEHNTKVRASENTHITLTNDSMTFFSRNRNNIKFETVDEDEGIKILFDVNQASKDIEQMKKDIEELKKKIN